MSSFMVNFGPNSRTPSSACSLTVRRDHSLAKRSRCTEYAVLLISTRAVNTLILVHRRQLMDQWRERLAAYFELPIENIGQFGGGRTKELA